MELESRDEADDPFRYAFRDLGQVMRCRDVGVGELIEAAGNAGENALFHQPRKCFRVDAGVAQLDATHGAAFLEKLDGPVSL